MIWGEHEREEQRRVLHRQKTYYAVTDLKYIVTLKLLHLGRKHVARSQ